MSEFQWVEVQIEIWAQLRTAVDIRERRPRTQTHHDAERAAGWPGPNGSSMSPDTAWGMRLGHTGPDYVPDMPTDDHDGDYRAIRRMLVLGQITEEEAEELRQCADEMLLIRMVHKAARLSRFLRPLREERALTYYRGVRFGGASSIRPQTEESYPRLAPSSAA